MMRRILLGGAMAIALAAPVIPAASQARHEPGASQPPHQEHQQPGVEESPVQAQEHRMMQMRQEMMADMAAMDARLNELVAVMNSASGEAKVNALAEVVTVLVEQRTAMRDRMMQMHGRMMGRDMTGSCGSGV